MRARFAERPAAQQRGWVFMASVGMVGVLAVLVLVYVGFRSPDSIPGRSYYTIKAKFTNGDNLTAHYQVRDDGKLVGQVLNPRVENGEAVVDLQLDPSIKPLMSDTTIEIRPRSAIGVRYVDIKPGREGTPLKDGATVPASQTSATIPLDEVLGTFDTKTRANSQKFLRELGRGFAGRGEDLSEAVGGAPATLRATSGWLSAIADRKGSVRSLIGGGGTIAGSADPVRDAIATGFAPEARALKPFTDEREAIHATLDEAPGALSTIRAELPVVDPLVEQLRGFAREIRPALQAGPEAFGQTSALLRESRPGLVATKQTLRTANRAVGPTLNLLKSVNPVLPDIDSALTNLSPTALNLGDYSCDVLNFGKRWTSMMSNGNDDGSVLRININFGPESVYGQTTRLSGEPPQNPYPKPCQAGHELGGQ